MGNDDNLNHSQLMCFAGRFTRGVHAYVLKYGIPLIQCQAKERKHKIAESYFSSDPNF